jgi:hypothetical protein
MQFLAIVGVSVLAAIVYGILHDQITARICVEYFTIGHPPIFRTQSPTLLAFGWGVLATWWVGLLLGIPLAAAARLGGRPKRDVADLIRPILVLFGITGSMAIVGGITGFFLARAGLVWLEEPLAYRVPPVKHVAFLTDLWAHNTGYVAAFLGGLGLIGWTWKSRGRLVKKAN